MILPTEHMLQCRMNSGMASSFKAMHVESGPLNPDELAALDAYWRAANYLSVGQIYLLDNPRRAIVTFFCQHRPHCMHYQEVGSTADFY